MNDIKQTSAGAITRILKGAGLRRRRNGTSIGFSSWQRDGHVSVHIHDPFSSGYFHTAVETLMKKGYLFDAKQTTRDRAVMTIHGRRTQ